MKTTLEIPDDVLRKCKAAAAMRGESVEDFVADALRARLEAESLKETPISGWRRVFGRAKPEDVASVDAFVADELESVDPDSWR